MVFMSRSFIYLNLIRNDHEQADIQLQSEV